MGKEIVILLILFISFLVLKYFQTKNKILSSILFIIYAGSFLTSILLILFFEQQRILLIPALFLMFVLLLWILPFNISNSSIVSITYNIRKVKIFSWLLISFLLPATLFYAYYSYLTYTTVNLSVFRYDLSENSLIPPNILNTIFSHISSLYFFVLVLFFIALRDKWSNTIKILLFISSFAFIFRTLASAGRDGVIFWIFNFIVLFLIFKEQIDQKLKKSIIKYFLIFTILFSFIFLTITIARFSIITGGNSKDILFSLLDYYGQQTENFCDIFYLDSEKYISLFSGINSLFYENYEQLRSTSVSMHMYQQGVTDNETIVFGFFVKTLVWGYGFLGTIFISVFFFVLISLLRKRFESNKDLFVFLIIYLLFQIPLDGVFYYRQGNGKMDLPYLLGIALCVIFKLRLGKKKQTEEILT